MVTTRDLTHPGEKGLSSVCERRDPTFVGSDLTAFKGNRLTLI